MDRLADLGGFSGVAVPTMFFAIAPLFLYIVLTNTNGRQSLIAIVATGALTLALYAPALLTLGLSRVSADPGTAPLPKNLWLGTFHRELRSLWKYWNLDLPVVVSILIVAGIILALVSRRTLERTLKLAGIPSTEVLSVRKIAHYPDADVYLGERASGQPFTPAGDSDMGVFTSVGN